MIESFTPEQINISQSAVDALESIIDGMGEDASAVVGLRVFVTGGGCSGFQYGFSFAQSLDEDDAVFPHGDVVKLVVDPMSYQYLVGATVDYVTDLHGSQFLIQNNPNASTSCGCGNSFSV